mmetsp:Transcript_12315/g.18246  ORF Transcript_12315/g.18246 Transcript_12315/m.18246 type:complete len:103 (+) Transcript_12315:155-463(+)
MMIISCVRVGWWDEKPGERRSFFPGRICGKFPVLVGYLRTSLLVPGQFLGSTGDVASCVGFPHAFGHRMDGFFSRSCERHQQDLGQRAAIQHIVGTLAGGLH